MSDAAVVVGVPVELSPLVRRLTCPNPGVMTGPGTNTYLVGREDVVVIDPGPDDAGHLDAVVAAAGDRIKWIVVTHTHPDHSPGAEPLRARLRPDVAVLGFEARDGFEPDAPIGDGQVIAGDGFFLRAVHTPGHAGNHLCYLLEEEGLLFSGDHIMNGSTVVIGPPDGDMAIYLESLERVRHLGVRAIAPAHGAVIADPTAKIDEYVGHRRDREEKVVAALDGRRSRHHRRARAGRVLRRRRGPVPDRPPVAVGPLAQARGRRSRRVDGRGRRRVDVGDPDRPLTYRVTVVVPAFNEAARIGRTVQELRTALADVGEGGAEVIVVDDGSTDYTATAAEEAGADTVVRLGVNSGKGAAVRAGVAAATGRTIVYTDADLSYPPDQVLALLARVEQGSPFVAGSRKHVDTVTLIRGRRLREVSGRVFNLLSRLVVLGRYRDTQCGLKAFDAATAQLLFGAARVDGFAFDVELFLLAEHFGVPIVEVPVRVSNAASSSVQMSRDARRMIGDLALIRRWSRDGTYGARR